MTETTTDPMDAVDDHAASRLGGPDNSNLHETPMPQNNLMSLKTAPSSNFLQTTPINSFAIPSNFNSNSNLNNNKKRRKNGKQPKYSETEGESHSESESDQDSIKQQSQFSNTNRIEHLEKGFRLIQKENASLRYDMSQLLNQNKSLCQG